MTLTFQGGRVEKEPEMFANSSDHGEEAPLINLNWPPLGNSSSPSGKVKDGLRSSSLHKI